MNKLIPGLILGFLMSASAMAETSSVAPRIKSQIRRIIKIEKHVERLDLPALMVLKRAAQNAVDSIDENGAAHLETIRRLHELFIVYRFSKDLLEQIMTDVTEDKVVEIAQITTEIQSDTGFDEPPHMMVTKSVYEQINRLFDRLASLNISFEVHEAVAHMKPFLGNLVQIAHRGDSMTTFKAAEVVYLEIKKLYPLFRVISSADAAFAIVMEIQGLNEHYRRHADWMERSQ